MILHPVCQLGKSSNCMSMVCSGSCGAYITEGSSTGLEMTSSLAIELDVKFNSLPAGGVRYFLFGKWNRNSTSDSNYRFVYYYTGSTYYLLLDFVEGTSLREHYVTWTPSLDTWYHLAVSSALVSTTRTTQFSVNGSQQGSDQVRSSATSLNTSGSAWITTGFGYGSTSNGDYHDGLIDNVKVFNSPRSFATISANMGTEETSGTDQKLSLLMNASLVDSTSINDFTASGTVAWSYDTPW